MFESKIRGVHLCNEKQWCALAVPFCKSRWVGCVQSPVWCTNAEPLGFLVCYLPMMHRAVLVQPFQWLHIQINCRAWLNGDHVLFWQLQEQMSSWRINSSKVFINCSCLWPFCKWDPPAHPPTQTHSAVPGGLLPKNLSTGDSGAACFTLLLPFMNIKWGKFRAL